MTAPFPISLPAVQQRSKAAFKGAESLDATSKSIEALILDSIKNQPRSLQKRIGPSELGTPCEHCLAAKLAGWNQVDAGIGWASTVGTGIHALFEDFIDKHETNGAVTDGVYPRRYVTEYPITVGQIGGVDITGSIDCLDLETGTTIDWKCVGATNLNKYRKGPSEVYRAQAHLYAKGCNNHGIKVERVSICFLPRASNNFFQRHWWSEPYNPEIAESALGRANRVHNNLAAFEAISTEARDNYISGLPRAPDCWDCGKYADAPVKERQVDGISLDLPAKK